MKKITQIIFTMFAFLFIISPFFDLKIVYSEEVQTYTRGVFIDDDVYLRTGPGRNYSPVKTDTGSEILLSSPESVEILSTTNGWYKIKVLYSGFLYTGYVSSQYVQATTITIDNNYKASLISKGFPESYAKKLAIMHALHPTWNFEIHNLNLDFNTAINEESVPVNRNLINSSNSSLRSTQDGAFVNGTYTQYGTGWYAASKQTIGYYLDPRNFLDEGHIFMFEQLSYNKQTHTQDAVSQILKGSFMDDTKTYNYNSIDYTYSKTFMDAANKSNVSPVYLSSLALQEQGYTGSVLSLGKGYNGNYQGLYNFYNIGATGNDDNTIIINGFNTAKSRGWTSPYLSIVNGASDMADEYINDNQDTIYYKKFNTVNRVYWHQYQQNVQAAYSEAYKTYVSYKESNYLERAFTFKIPVYKNMPEATTLSTSENGDNALKSLSIPNCTLSPTFISSALNYTTTVPYDTSSITVNAEKNSLYSTINGTGKYDLKEGNNTITVTVTAANSTERKYTITVTRLPKPVQNPTNLSPSDIISTMGYNNSNNKISGFKLNTNSSEIISEIKNKNANAIVTLNATNTNGKIATGNKITIENNNIKTEFTVVIYGDISGDGIIDNTDLLKVQKHIKKAKTLDGISLTSADVNKDGKIDNTDLLKIQKYIKQGTIIAQ